MAVLRACSVDVNAGVTADVDAAVAAGPGLRLMGLAWREVAGSAAVATFTVVNGAVAATGTLLIPVEVAANGSGYAWFGPHGLAATGGLSIDHVAGAVDVTLFYLTGE